MEWLAQFWESLTLGKVLLGVGLFLFSFTISILAVAIVMVKIPADYFSSHYSPEFMTDKPWLVRWSVVILKNALGIILVLIGIVLSLPGVPGQGILTILLGLIMLDIPGKRPIEAKIIRRPNILAAVNDLRARYNKSPLVMD
jgi:hypothetical protein